MEPYREPSPPQSPGRPANFDDKFSHGQEGEESRSQLGTQFQREIIRALSPNLGATKSEPATIEELRRLSLSPAPSGRLSPLPHGTYVPLGAEASPSHSHLSALRRFWLRNKAAALVATAQLFGALMNLFARLLELEGEGMHPLQVLFMRQTMTCACSMLYMWYMQTPGFPFGPKEVRWLLAIRGFIGFFGIYGMWYSMMYLPLADATVITFLAPGVAGLLCFLTLRQPFTRVEQIATLVALVGVVLIAQPAAFFQSQGSGVDEEDNSTIEPPDSASGGSPGLDHVTTPTERVAAVGVALLGVLGAATAFTCVRAIGKRAHPLISVNAFSIACLIISTSALIFAPILDIAQPHLRWHNPTSFRQLILCVGIGIVGFLTQYLLTAGLSMDKTNRANSMVYTHMLFAASFDRWVFGHEMGLMSFAGCTLILGSAVWVVVSKKAPAPARTGDEERLENPTGEAEESPMLVEGGNEVEEVPLETVDRTHHGN